MFEPHCLIHQNRENESFVRGKKSKVFLLKKWNCISSQSWRSKIYIVNKQRFGKRSFDKMLGRKGVKLSSVQDDEMATFQDVPAINIAKALSDKDLQLKLAQHLRYGEVQNILNEFRNSETKGLDSNWYKRLINKLEDPSTYSSGQIIEDLIQELTKTTDRHARDNNIVCIMRAIDTVKYSVVPDILTKANNEYVTQLLEIDELVCECIRAADQTFYSNLRREDLVLTKLLVAKLITDEDHRKLQSKNDSAKRVELHSVLQQLSTTEKKMEFIAILRQSGNKRIAEEIIRREDEDKITKMKREAQDGKRQ